MKKVVFPDNRKDRFSHGPGDYKNKEWDFDGGIIDSFIFSIITDNEKNNLKNGKKLKIKIQLCLKKLFLKSIDMPSAL